MSAEPVMTRPARGHLLTVILSSRTATLGAAIVIALILLAVLATFIAPYEPLAQSLVDRTQPPSTTHLFGTDRLGRDIFSRILYGARLSLLIGAGSVAVGVILGVTVGLAAGYVRGWVDTVAMRFVDIVLAFPLSILAMVVVAILGVSIGNTMLAVGLATFPQFARLVRGQVLAIREQEFITAAVSLGAHDIRTLVKHVLPQVLGPVTVLATLTVGSAILVEASLSFIGLGPSPPAPSWGLMIFDGLAVLQRAPWVALAPGLAITLVVIGFNLLGDGMRDALDPKSRMR